MKLAVETNEVVLSNVVTTGEFRIRNSAKAFSILSSGLYSNKIRAIIRELSCNAVDSHVAAGNENTPFVVHLPSVLEPWFSVQDFGTGLDDQQIINIYTTYFESTKTDSNAFIGALGLGSKSPFSYTENFTVTAIKNGTKRIYSAFINDSGVPSIAEMTTELTDEPNGVEVKFSVNDKSDYNSFRYEAGEVFKWFKNKPTITGSTIDIPEISYKEKDIVPGVSVLNNNGYHTSSFAIMGNIAYPLDSIPEPEKHLGNLSNLLKCGLVIEFGIGELDFAASREELSYIPHTLRGIKARLQDLNDNLMAHFAAKADAIAGEWEKAYFLYTESSNKLYSSAVAQYAKDTKFPLYDSTAYHGRKMFEKEVTELKKQGLSVVAFSAPARSSRNARIGVNNKWDSNKSAYVEYASIPVDPQVVFVLNDLKTGCEARSRYHFNNNNSGKYVSVFCISHTSDDLTVRQAAYDALLKELHNPPVVVKASSLTKREPVKREKLSSSGIMYMTLKERKGYYYNYSTTETTWKPLEGEIDDNATYYYVCLNNYEPETIAGTKFNAVGLYNLMARCGIADISKIVIHGVRKNRIKDIKDLPNWIWIEDKIKEEVLKIPDEQVISMVSERMIDNHSISAYTNSSVAKSVGASSDYSKFAKKYTKKKTTDYDDKLTPLVKLCEQYGRTVKIDDIKKEITAEMTLITKKYPLLKFCYDAPITEMVQYVKLIDNQESI